MVKEKTLPTIEKGALQVCATPVPLKLVLTLTQRQKNATYSEM